MTLSGTQNRVILALLILLSIFELPALSYLATVNHCPGATARLGINSFHTHVTYGLHIFAFPWFVWWASSSIQTAPLFEQLALLFFIFYTSFAISGLTKAELDFWGPFHLSNLNYGWLKSAFNSQSPVSILSLIIYSFLLLQNLFHIQCADTESRCVGLFNLCFLYLWLANQKEGHVLLEKKKTEYIW